MTLEHKLTNELSLQVVNNELFLGAASLVNDLEWKPLDGVNKLCSKKDGPGVGYEEAEIYVIGTILHDLFRLTATGGWSAQFTSKFASQKASGRLHHNGNPTISAVWDAMQAGATAIQNSKKTPGASLGNSLFVEGALRIRHTLFEVRSFTSSKGRS